MRGHRKMFAKLRRLFHRCKGLVVYKYPCDVKCFGKYVGKGEVSIVECEVCHKTFATLDTATESIDVNVYTAVTEALRNFGVPDMPVHVRDKLYTLLPE